MTQKNITKQSRHAVGRTQKENHDKKIIILKTKQAAPFGEERQAAIVKSQRAIPQSQHSKPHSANNNGGNS